MTEQRGGVGDVKFRVLVELGDPFLASWELMDDDDEQFLLKHWSSTLCSGHQHLVMDRKWPSFHENLAAWSDSYVRVQPSDLQTWTVRMGIQT